MIASCQSILGFGRRVTWKSDLVVPPGHQMTFKDALHIVSTNLVLKSVFPDWAKYLTKQTRKTDLAFNELKVRSSNSLKCACVIHSYPEQQYMLEMVKARRDGDKVEERYDLFSGLLDAAEDEQESEAAISDDELFGGYSTSRLFGILGRRLNRPPRKHVYLSHCWT